MIEYSIYIHATMRLIHLFLCIHFNKMTFDTQIHLLSDNFIYFYQHYIIVFSSICCLTSRHVSIFCSRCSLLFTLHILYVTNILFLMYVL